MPDEVSLCLTHHERLDGNTGMVLVSAAIREVEGQNKKSLMIMVPLGMAIPPGIRAAVYTKDQWAKAAKNEKIDEKTLKPIELKYSLCHPAGCTAETEATSEILDQMSKGGGIMVLAMNAQAQPIGFPVPLDGYNEATAGPPVDNKKYAEARSALMKQIRERQQKLAEKFKADEMKNLPLDAPGVTADHDGLDESSRRQEEINFCTFCIISAAPAHRRGGISLAELGISRALSVSWPTPDADDTRRCRR